MGVNFMEKNVKKIMEIYPEYKQEIKLFYSLCTKTSFSNKVSNFGFVEEKLIGIYEQIAKIKSDIQLVEEDIEYCEKKNLYIKSKLDSNNYSFYSYVEIKYPNKYKKLTHSDVLGAFLNNDINYMSIGGIIVSEDGQINIIIETNIIELLAIKVPKIANINVKYELLEDLTFLPEQKNIKSYIVSSIRIDTITKNLIKKSRTEAQKQITNKKVSINHQIVLNSKKNIKVDDVISIRQFGRFVICEIIPKTNGKYIVKVR